MLDSIGGIVLGRITDERCAAHSPSSTQPEAERMNTLPKYVVSTTLTEATWSNTTIISDNVPAAIIRLKEESGEDLAILEGSALAPAPAAHGLIDEYRFLVVPVILGRASASSTASPSGSA
jgi:dihydrofolate reductase